MYVVDLWLIYMCISSYCWYFLIASGEGLRKLAGKYYTNNTSGLTGLIFLVYVKFHILCLLQ